MSVRKICAALGATAVAVTGLAGATLAPANADPSSTPGATDYVGVGSDTTQFVVTDLINGKTVNGTAVPGYNSTVTAGNPLMASFDACTTPSATQLYPCTPGSATDTTQYIKLRSTSTASIPRPNGSGAGKKLLFGTTDNPDVTFARSSGGLSTAEVGAGLVAYPFAVDTLVTVTAPNTNAPANLTAQQILGIYTGKYTNWSQLGGKDGVINPLQPQSGSGTLAFFLAQMQTANGGTAITSVGKDHEDADTTTHKPCSPESSTCVNTSVQEHDPTLITNDPNAIAPFSLGRANLAGPSAVTVVQGFSARRALYNVLRSKDAGNTAKDNPLWFSGTDQMNKLFGANGFFCSQGARAIIEADGFKQLLSNADGGSCGSPVTTTSAPDLSVYDANGVASKVTAAVTGTAYGQDHTVTVTVTGAGGTPTGTVNVNVNGQNYPGTLSGGTATVTVPGSLKAGSYDAAVTYPGDNNFQGSSSDTPFTVTKAATNIAANATSGKYGQTHAMTVNVEGSGSPTGTVTVKVGSLTLNATLADGTAHLTLPASLAAGSYHPAVTYNGDDNNTVSTGTAALTVSKASSATSTSFPAKSKGRTLVGKVIVKANPSGAAVSGPVLIKAGSRTIAKANLSRGVATVRIPTNKLHVGKNTFKAVYAGSSNVGGSSKTFSVRKG